MTKGKKHITEKDFKDYLNNEMSDTERNAFEKALQSNPFEAEALEGFERFPLPGIENDLQELKSKIHTKKRTRRIPYFAAAASILLLVTAGVLWMQLDKENPLPETSEVKHEVKSQEKKEREEQLPIQGTKKAEQILPTEAKREPQKTAKKSDPPVEKAAPVNTPDKQQEAVIFDETKEDNLLSIQTSGEREKKSATPKARSIKSARHLPSVNHQKTVKIRGVSQSGIIRGQVVSADDQMPIAGATIVEKGTNNGIITDIDGHFQLQLKNDTNPTVVASFIGMETNEFRPTKDSNIIQLKPEDLALNEVVIVGYAAQKKQSLTGSTTSASKNNMNKMAMPVGGVKAYNNHLKEKAILPPEHSKNKVSLKLLLFVNKEGDIDSIDYQGAYPELFKEAQKIILEGPSWNPKFENGNKVAARVKLKVTFRKK